MSACALGLGLTGLWPVFLRFSEGSQGFSASSGHRTSFRFELPYSQRLSGLRFEDLTLGAGSFDHKNP